MQGRSIGLIKTLGVTTKFVSIYVRDKFLERGVDITRQQFILLKVLSERGSTCQNELAFITERDKTSLTRLATGMEKKGFIKRIPDKLDLRKKNITLTKKGSQILEKTWPVMSEIEYELTVDIKPEELQSMINILNKIQTKVIGTESVKL